MEKFKLLIKWAIITIVAFEDEIFLVILCLCGLTEDKTAIKTTLVIKMNVDIKIF